MTNITMLDWKCNNNRKVSTSSLSIGSFVLIVLVLIHCTCDVSCWIITTKTLPVSNMRTIAKQQQSLLPMGKTIRNTHHPLMKGSFNNKNRFLHQQLQLSTSNNNNILATTDLTDKIIFQRVFYSLRTGSDVDIIKSIVIEERKRYIVDPNNSNRIIPIGPITLILRNGNVDDDNEIGTEFYTINLPESSSTISSSNDPLYEASIVTALYLASNPLLCTGQLLHIGIDQYGGFGTILGCIGASYVLGEFTTNSNNNNDDDNIDKTIDDDVLTINTKNVLLPKNLDRITLTDESIQNLEIAMDYCAQSNIKSNSKLLVEQLQWRIPHQRSSSDTLRNSRNNNNNFMGLTDNNIDNQQRIRYKEYNTIIACGIDYTYPETKEMARTIANRVECISRTRNPHDSVKALSRFVNIFCENRDTNVSYLRSYLEKGYKMSTSIDYIKLEKLIFQYQIVPNDIGSRSGSTNNEDNILDDLELELLNVIEKNYQSLVSIHHPDYIGGGSGEYFFPMETGEYDSTISSSTQSYLEPDPGTW
jgi:hypothetical protein